MELENEEIFMPRKQMAFKPRSQPSEEGGKDVKSNESSFKRYKTEGLKNPHKISLNNIFNRLSLELHSSKE